MNFFDTIINFLVSICMIFIALCMILLFFSAVIVLVCTIDWALDLNVKDLMNKQIGPRPKLKGIREKLLMIFKKMDTPGREDRKFYRAFIDEAKSEYENVADTVETLNENKPIETEKNIDIREHEESIMVSDAQDLDDEEYNKQIKMIIESISKENSSDETI